MLSEKQRELIALKVNEDMDIPFFGESTEGRIIDKVIDTVDPHLEPAMRVLCPAPYVDCLKIALEEGSSVEDKRRRICEIMRPTLAEPLAREMAGVIDVAMVPENMEERVLEVVTRKIVEEFVEWTVGEIDERLSQRLESSREFAAASAEE